MRMKQTLFYCVRLLKGKEPKAKKPKGIEMKSLTDLCVDRLIAFCSNKI